MQTTCGTLLGGRVRYAQPAEGYRTGLEPVLLAACVPARPGQRVMEAGCGAGAGLLCLLARVPGLVATGIERDPDLADLARANLAANGWAATIQAGDVANAAGPVDHAFANPPWHDPAGSPPAHARRLAAKQRADSGLAGWVAPLAAALAPRGTLSLALPAALLAEAVALIQAAGLRGLTLLPLWPRQGRAAKLMILQARRGRAASRILPGLVLHGPGPELSEAAEQVLRQAAPIDLGGG